MMNTLETTRGESLGSCLWGSLVDLHVHRLYLYGTVLKVTKSKKRQRSTKNMGSLSALVRTFSTIIYVHVSMDTNPLSHLETRKGPPVLLVERKTVTTFFTSRRLGAEVGGRLTFASQQQYHQAMELCIYVV
jgi:tRNA nucleotidyltransferase (CCA-adding enzyme)